MNSISETAALKKDQNDNSKDTERPDVEQVSSPQSSSGNTRQSDCIATSLADIYIGTAGYSYPHWRKGVFYPNHVTQAQELRHYSGVFSTVEINASFHAVPRQETLVQWRQMVKSGFTFAFKVPQKITHEMRLENIDDALTYFLNRLYETMVLISSPKDETKTSSNNQSKPTKPCCLGPVLFQLPPSLSKDITKLTHIYNIIQAQQQLSFSGSDFAFQVAFEFRNKSWYGPEVYQVLKQYQFGICENISPDQTTIHVPITTADTWHYMRFHKRGDRLVTNYTTSQLESIAETLLERRRRGIRQYGYFLNDHEGNGPRNAKTLLSILKQKEKESFTTQQQQPLVATWKPDPSVPSISKMFQRQQQQNTSGNKKTTATSAHNTLFAQPFQKPTTTTPNTQDKNKRSIESFFGKSPTTTGTSNGHASATPATLSSPPSKRLKTTGPTLGSKQEKGRITSFFATSSKNK